MRRRPVWTAVLAAALAVGIGLGATSLALFLQAKAAARPEAIVAAYLTHVRDGEIEAAMRMEGRTPDRAEVLLTDRAYANATDRLSGFRIQDVRRDGDAALVDVETTAAGETTHATLELERAGWTPGEWLGVVAWRLKPADLAMVDVAVGAPHGVTATLAGMPVDVGAHPTLLAFPGRYALDVAADSPWFTLKGAAVTVSGFQQRDRVATSAELTPAGLTAAKAAANAWVDACLGGGTEPPGCSFSLDGAPAAGEEWTGERWTVTTPPQLSVSAWNADCRLPGQQAGTGCWPVGTLTPGAVAFSADYRIPSTGEEGTITTTSPIELDVEGGVTAFVGSAARFTSVEWR